ncbi:MAG: hypothetical protein QM774_11200 [Gordonia sp. (in: high G+C Gram-positive bacteria)]|uniref:hypothetical protein n=1 Tax=Gordonia sp. (in: high G+C Gram-positive bacteria) TaxID=84139 RepID=UPI0039E3482A
MHTHKEWQITLDMARERGWTATVGSNHSVTYVECPAKNPQCRVKAFSTGRGAENAARNSRNKIRNCIHAETGLLETATLRMDSAETFLTATSAELTLRSVGRRAEELLEMLDQVDSALDEAASAVERLGEEFTETAEREQQARDARDRAIEAVGGGTPQEWIVQAGSDLRRAEQDIKGVPKKQPSSGAARKRLDSLKNQCAELRKQISTETSNTDR